MYDGKSISIIYGYSYESGCLVGGYGGVMIGNGIIVVFVVGESFPYDPHVGGMNHTSQKWESLNPILSATFLTNLRSTHEWIVNNISAQVNHIFI